MALLYGYGTGSIVESFRYDDVANLLNQIPNNTLNLVKASDVRDSVFTLWERINDLSVIVASSSTTPTTYMNPDPTMVTVGGVVQGTTFPTPQTIQQMFDAILYPYTLPTISLGPNITREYGPNLTYNINWSVIKKTYPILTVVIEGFSISGITGNNQSGTRIVSGTYSFPLLVSTTNTFTMQVGDGTSIVTTTATITWMNKIYWGSIDLSGLPLYPNPNLTLNPAYASYVAAIIDRNLILALNGAGVGSGSELATSKSKTYNGINGNGKYLIFAWPSSVSGSSTPTFVVAGLLNSAFTMVKTGWSFTNQNGITTNYEVWVSNTAYNSATNIIIS
jgi:hypothetical protein